MILILLILASSLSYAGSLCTFTWGSWGLKLPSKRLHQFFQTFVPKLLNGILCRFLLLLGIPKSNLCWTGATIWPYEHRALQSQEVQKPSPNSCAIQQPWFSYSFQSHRWLKQEPTSNLLFPILLSAFLFEISTIFLLEPPKIHTQKRSHFHLVLSPPSLPCVEVDLNIFHTSKSRHPPAPTNPTSQRLRGEDIGWIRSGPPVAAEFQLPLLHNEDKGF